MLNYVLLKLKRKKKTRKFYVMFSPYMYLMCYLGVKYTLQYLCAQVKFVRTLGIIAISKSYRFIFL